ncbi:hypothetical protein L2089_01970 [Paenibacillus hunanensis]|uniref:hypothetical protein n=1 Tax=Paenibacillus hunanensis TaxID=539262 RepID=UPI002026C50A|nr:hypothetical protein [Paenibacillus hunanensis]MCL9659431.1 hypothetical protein [Paenibacillus hunanensis]
MLLGSEYEMITKIAMNYTWHSTIGAFQFSENDYRLKFPEDNNLFYLKKLISKGYAEYINNNQLKVDSVVWVNEFIKKLQKEISLKGYDYILSYNLQENTILIKLKDKELFKLNANFNSNTSNYDTIISFVYIPTLEPYIFWMDLLNDPILLDMFLAFLEKKLSSLNFKFKLSFSFFDGLDNSFISDIFYVSIQNYFQDGGFNLGKLNDQQFQWISKHYLKENIEAYTVKKDDIEIILFKSEERIDFLSFNEMGEIYYNPLVNKEFSKLENALKLKISSFRRVNMYLTNKSADVGRKITQTTIIILTALNLVFMFGVSSLKIIWMDQLLHSMVAYIAIVVLLFLIILGYVFWLVVPNIKLITFNWKLKYG